MQRRTLNAARQCVRSAHHRRSCTSASACTPDRSWRAARSPISCCARSPDVGVVAAAGGNLGAAGGYAAHSLGVPARIHVPTVSSPAKITQIRGYGADLVIEGDTYSEALAVSERWRERTPARSRCTPSDRRSGALVRQGLMWSL
ncbi:pyridoxal-phosphate dependent enzyme [Micromonospora sp. LOL_023]|uniref:pyridoxal-phosphate dependent enzyme n=1 Tax=Micromonospora sp. LOL_023 TaxID=3345418 RepID=UPI003A8948BB